MMNMTTYDEILARLKTAHMFFGAQAGRKGDALLEKYLTEGVISREEYEKLKEENRTMECEEVWTEESD